MAHRYYNLPEDGEDTVPKEGGGEATILENMAASPDACVEEVPEDGEETVTEEGGATTPEDMAATPSLFQLFHLSFLLTLLSLYSYNNKSSQQTPQKHHL